MILNTKEIINQKNQNSLISGPPSDWCPLQHPRALMGLSRRRVGRDDVLKLIDSREIRWAWDIARKGARRPEVRIWRESLLAYLARERQAPSGAKPEEPELGEVIGAILPKPWALTPRAATLRGTELQRRFLCCRTHLAGLIADGELSCVGPAGPGRNPAVLYQSVFEFLKRRTM
jgi:hypothetical protein